MKIMKKVFMISMMSILMAGMMISSCSESRDEQQPESAGNAIRFNAAAPVATRVAPTTSATLDKFVVYAYTNGVMFMDNVLVSRQGGSWVYTPLAYWPATPVNFYAVSPVITNSTDVGSGGNGTIPNYNNNGQTDLLYAVSLNEYSRQAPVRLNFRHAMSDVNVMLSSENQSVEVKVGHVSLKNISMQGTFNFPKASTTAEEGGAGDWTDLGKKQDLLLTYYFEESDFATLTDTPVNLTLDNLNVNFMLPQPLTAYSYTATGGYIGSYIQIDCEIFDRASGKKIWPNEDTPPSQLVAESDLGLMAFPLTTETVTEWKPGYSYIYNVVIDYPTDHNPIRFDVTVDEFQTGMPAGQ